ncbi:MAG: LPS export ABC transporter periplasmic protein LptC [Nostocaceae cyanobacterium]|nr:LPS export ABC transporter periplasmic protein LptC [Nostocaceae cyanobacterium]
MKFSVLNQGNHLKQVVLHYLLFSPRSLLILGLTLSLSTGLVGCGAGAGGGNRVASKLAEDASQVENLKSGLILNKLDFQQADEQGKLLWRVKAKEGTYSPDKKIAQVKIPNGELYQDGTVVYKVQALEGEIREDGQLLFLQGQIVATDPKNGVVLRGNELEWHPKEDLLIVRNQLNGTHKQMQAVAQEARVKTREERIQLIGGVVARSIDPAMQLRTERVTWLVKQEKLFGDRPVQIDRFQGQSITDRATGNAAEVNLKTKIATLKQNAQLSIFEPPMQVASNLLIWNLNQETVTSNVPVQVFHRPTQTTVSANQGKVIIPQKVVYLTGNVKGVGQKGQTLNANQMTYYLSTQIVEAKGNVVYRQVADTPVTFTGQTAVGKLQDGETLVVKGGKPGGDGRVVTEIVPRSLGIGNR